MRDVLATNELLPRPSRYVYTIEPACPFCGGKLGPSEHIDTRPTGQRVKHRSCKVCGERVYEVVERPVFRELENLDCASKTRRSE